MTLVLDTSVVSALMRRETDALARLANENPGDVLLSSPVLAEIRFGLERLAPGRRRELLRAEWVRLRAVLGWCDWTEPAAEAFGREKARLERSGTPLDDMDIAIGSIAIASSARLATRNVRHFRRLVGITTEDWST